MVFTLFENQVRTFASGTDVIEQVWQIDFVPDPARRIHSFCFAQACVLVKIGKLILENGFPKTQKEVVRSVGFTKLNQTLERPDTPSMRGVVAKVPHLLRIIE